jgi:hypothetical protein
MTIPSLAQLVAAVASSEPSDLDRVRAAVEAADELGSLGDRVVTHFVESARAAGCSWSQIGAQLGVSKQAAQQAFVAPMPRRRRFGRTAPSKPFERWTERARAALDTAQLEAAALGHNWLGTEHLLLGLAQGDGVAARALGRLGVEPDTIRDHVVDIIGRVPETGTGDRPFTSRTKKILDLAVREAARFHHDYVGTEHLLLGLVREGEGLAAQILVKRMGVDLPRLVEETMVTDGGSPRTRGGRSTC